MAFILETKLDNKHLLTLQKITTKYDTLEDRFCISALASNGSVFTLWASHRILTRLLPPIYKWLDAKKDLIPQMDNESKELMNDFAQHQARTELKPEKPVQNGDPAFQNSATDFNTWLIHEIDIKHSDQLMELSFKDAHNRIVKLPLTKLYARQWLIILHSQWIKSEWPMAVWPEWLTQTSAHHATQMH